MILTSTPSSLELGSELVSEVVPKPVTRASESGAGECEGAGRHTGVTPLPGVKVNNQCQVFPNLVRACLV